jgi:hypothetical protein
MPIENSSLSYVTRAAQIISTKMTLKNDALIKLLISKMNLQANWIIVHVLLVKNTITRCNNTRHNNSASVIALKGTHNARLYHRVQDYLLYLIYDILLMWQHIYWKKREKKQDYKSYLDSKSTIFEVINSFRLYDRVCIVSALRHHHHKLDRAPTSQTALSALMG